MKGERTAKTVFDEILLKADAERFFVDSRSGIYGINPRDEEKRNKVFADQVGRLVLELPEADRELLKNMSSDDLEEFGWVTNGWSRPRPEKLDTRKRGPVSLRGTRVRQPEG